METTPEIEVNWWGGSRLRDHMEEWMEEAGKDKRKHVMKEAINRGNGYYGTTCLFEHAILLWIVVSVLLDNGRKKQNKRRKGERNSALTQRQTNGQTCSNITYVVRNSRWPQWQCAKFTSHAYYTKAIIVIVGLDHLLVTCASGQIEGRLQPIVLRQDTTRPRTHSRCNSIKTNHVFARALFVGVCHEHTKGTLCRTVTRFA